MVVIQIGDDMNRLNKILHTMSETPIDEMAYVCKRGDGYQIIIEVRSSNEHGVPHAHVRTVDGSKSGVIKITDSKPNTQDDVTVLSGVVDGQMKGRVIEWAKGVTKRKRLPNWSHLVETWYSLRPD